MCDGGVDTRRGRLKADGLRFHSDYATTWSSPGGKVLQWGSVSPEVSASVLHASRLFYTYSNY